MKIAQKLNQTLSTREKKKDVLNVFQTSFNE